MSLREDLASYQQALMDAERECTELEVALATARAQLEPTPRLIALTLAFVGGTDGVVADAIPQTVWTALHDEGLVQTVRDITGDGVTLTTPAGRDVLLAALAADPQKPRPERCEKCDDPYEGELIETVEGKGTGWMCETCRWWQWWPKQPAGVRRDG